MGLEITKQMQEAFRGNMARLRKDKIDNLNKFTETAITVGVSFANALAAPNSSELREEHARRVYETTIENMMENAVA